MKKAVLQFSGGMDSLACLYLLKDQWNDLTVVWQNTGAAFPETRVQMQRIRDMVPDFYELKTDVISDIKDNGWPSDVVPTRNTDWGRQITGEEGVKLRSWVDCCTANSWLPLHQLMLKEGVQEVYRGQRTSEGYKSPVRDGQKADGITYRFPIQDWTRQQVEAYLLDDTVNDIEIPENYQYMDKSLDCWCCTAYLEEKKPQLEYMKVMHPEKYSAVSAKLREIKKAVTRDSALYGDL